VTCSESGCDWDVHCRGVCRRHYRRLHYVEHERARRGAKEAKRYKIGDTWTAKKGYVFIKIGPGGRDIKLLHRHVMEQHLGRELLPTETVHHKNGDRSNNRLRNLELWSSRHPRGQRIKDLLEFAHEIIEVYG
jgi:hypothetical protein